MKKKNILTVICVLFLLLAAAGIGRLSAGVPLFDGQRIALIPLATITPTATPIPTLTPTPENLAAKQFIGSWDCSDKSGSLIFEFKENGEFTSLLQTDTGILKGSGVYKFSDDKNVNLLADSKVTIGMGVDYIAGKLVLTSKAYGTLACIRLRN